ncbi:MAG: HAD-IA family hydrolase, partial [Candidatus Aminicenantes bacterium]|nr:HAD-IA family hydrolase [Candidatus Aminicenantes bacterium]
MKYGELCTFANIYEILATEFRLPVPVRDTISNMEIELELSLVRPVPEILDALAFLHSLKKRVVFISDMYLPSKVIQDMLKKVGAFAPGDRIYVSNEYGKTKKTGKLFKHVLDSEGCSPDKILHVGDNLNADIRSAKKLGIQSLYFQNTHPNRYEKYIYKKNRLDDPACQIFTGASRAARLDCPFPAGREKVLYELGADVAAPILIQYIQWVLLDAQKHNIKRLYFLSRDGQILLEIAESLQKYIKTDIELRYLYASRLAWNFPAITELDEDSFNLFIYESPIISIEALSLKTGLDPHSIQKAMEDYSGRTISIHQILSKTNLSHLHQILKSPPFSETLLDLAAQKRSALISYLEQERIFDDHCSAVVDLGWKGSLQDALLKLINTTGKIQHCPIRGYYFGVGRLFQTHVPPQDILKSGFYYSPGHPQPPFPTRILEVFTSGDHGLTLSYTRDKDGVWLPQLKEPRNRDVLDWGLQALRLGIRNFIKSIPRDAEIIFHRMNYYKASEHINYLINRLTLHPTKEEIAALAKYPFNMDSADLFVSDLAPSFN